MKYIFKITIIIFCLIIVIKSFALPREISGKDTAGGCCSGTSEARCGSRPNKECVDLARRCIEGGDLRCSTAVFPHSCCVDESCACMANQNCN